MFWIVFGAAIVVIATLCDSGDGGGGDGAGVGPVAVSYTHLTLPTKA